MSKKEDRCIILPEGKNLIPSGIKKLSLFGDILKNCTSNLCK